MRDLTAATISTQFAHMLLPPAAWDMRASTIPRPDHALYTGSEPVALICDFLVGLSGTEAAWALAGQARGDTPDPGPVVCSCFAVGRNTILREIAEKGLESVEAIGAGLSAGTNCGSCKAELAGLLMAARNQIRGQA
ncbi:(2Fe-2S)-binding protein (plasmid) [Thioclava sp. 'Guangxiensis']|uniref:(2Fe-2S)-binding protein n=1 Tax=Thioclava sp. 'Guangxiensis' TaxID=3149044 RepID=UPI003877E26C